MAKKKESESDSRVDPKQEERRRLRTLALSRKLLSRTPSQPPSHSLRPSAAVVRHQGRDLVKKGQRRNRFLFSFPGFIAPVGGGGRIGELADLGTGNPVLYLEFPHGRMKLFGTIVYPKNRYLTLQFAKKSVLCEDTFDSMIVFSDAWWIGRKEDNPDELKLDFPSELSEVKDSDYDFKGGVSASGSDKSIVSASGGDKPVGKLSKDVIEPLDLETEIDDDDTSQDSLRDIEDNITNATPVRQSSRLVGKSLNFAEKSSSDESVNNDSADSDGSDDGQDVIQVENSVLQDPPSMMDIDANNKDNEIPSLPENGPEISSKKIGRLVQSTLSTLFLKASEMPDSSMDTSPKPKGSGPKRQRKSPIDKTNVKFDSPLDISSEPKGSSAKRHRKSPIDKPSAANGSTKRGRKGVKQGVKRKLKLHQEEEDDIEEISSDPQEDDSDEDWVA